MANSFFDLAMHKLTEAQRERDDDVALTMISLAMFQYCKGLQERDIGDSGALDLAEKNLFRAATGKNRGDMIGWMALGFYQMCAAVREK